MPRTLKPPAVPVPPPPCSLGSTMPLAEFDRLTHASQGAGAAQAPQYQTTHTPFYHPLGGGGGVVGSARSSMLRSSLSSVSHQRQNSVVAESPTSAHPPPPSFFGAGPPTDASVVLGMSSMSGYAGQQPQPQKFTQSMHQTAFSSERMASPVTVAAPFASHAFQPQVPGACVGSPAAASSTGGSVHHQRVPSGHHHPHTVHFGSPIATVTPMGAGADEKAMIVAERFRTRMCRHAEAGGACPYTNHCMFAHAPEQLRTVEANLTDHITSEDAVRDFQHRELVHARKARRVARRRAKLQLARAAKAKEAGTDPLKGGSDHDDSDHDDDHSTTDHSDHDAEPAGAVHPVVKKKGTSPTEPQPKVAATAVQHNEQPRTAASKAVVTPTVASPTEAQQQHHRPRVTTTPRQSGAAHPPPPAYSASSAATSPTNGTARNASFVVHHHASPCCNCQCHCHGGQPVPSAPVVMVGSPMAAPSMPVHANMPRAAPSVPHHYPQHVQPAPQPVAFHHQQQQQQQQHSRGIAVAPAAPAPAEGSAAHQYGFASDYMAQLLLQAQAQQQEYDDDYEDEEAEDEWEGEQQPVQPAYYQGPQYAPTGAAAPHVTFVQPQQPPQQQHSGAYYAQPQAQPQPQQPIMPRSHSHHSFATVGPSHSQHWSPDGQHSGLGLGATAATMHHQHQQQQYGVVYQQQPTQPVMVPSPTAGGRGVVGMPHQQHHPQQQQHHVVTVSVGTKQHPYAPSPPASTYAPTPKATTAGTPTAGGAETASMTHTAGGTAKPNHYPMCQVQSQQQLNHQLHDMMRYQQQQYHQQHQPPHGHARSLSHTPANPLSADSPTARSSASHPHSHPAGHSQAQAVYDAARHIVLVETPVNGPDGIVRGSRTSWRHEPYDLLMPQHH